MVPTPAQAVHYQLLVAILLQRLAGLVHFPNSLRRVGSSAEEVLECLLLFVGLRREVVEGDRFVGIEEVGHEDAGVEAGGEDVGAELGLWLETIGFTMTLSTGVGVTDGNESVGLTRIYQRHIEWRCRSSLGQ